MLQCRALMWGGVEEESMVAELKMRLACPYGVQPRGHGLLDSPCLPDYAAKLGHSLLSESCLSVEDPWSQQKYRTKVRKFS